MRGSRELNVLRILVSRANLGWIQLTRRRNKERGAPGKDMHVGGFIFVVCHIIHFFLKNIVFLVEYHPGRKYNNDIEHKYGYQTVFIFPSIVILIYFSSF